MMTISMTMMMKHRAELLFVLFTLAIYTPTPTLQITIVKAQFLIISSSDYYDSSYNSSQTVRLFNKSELSKPPVRPIRIVESIPVDAIHSFRVVVDDNQEDTDSKTDTDDDDNNKIVYLTFRNSTRFQARFTHCVLLLSNDIAVNVSFLEPPTTTINSSKASLIASSIDYRHPHRSRADRQLQEMLQTASDWDEDDAEPNQKVRITVEYIFKLSNHSRFGLIKDDTPVNGILCIVKIFFANAVLTSQLDHEQVEVRIGSDYFQVKRFQKQFYMVQLVKTRQVLALDRLFEVNIEAFVRSTKIRLGRGRVRFLVVRTRELDIRLDRHDNARVDLVVDEDENSSSIIEDASNDNYELENRSPVGVWRSRPARKLAAARRPALYGGRYLTKIEPALSRAVFLDDESMSRYVRENLRFRIVSSNYPHTLVEIDAQKGKKKPRNLLKYRF